MREALGQGLRDMWPKAETQRPLHKAAQSSAGPARATEAGKEVRLVLSVVLHQRHVQGENKLNRKGMPLPVLEKPTIS